MCGQVIAVLNKDSDSDSDMESDEELWLSKEQRGREVRGVSGGWQGERLTLARLKLALKYEQKQVINSVALHPSRIFQVYAPPWSSHDLPGSSETLSALFPLSRLNSPIQLPLRQFQHPLQPPSSSLSPPSSPCGPLEALSFSFVVVT